MERDYFVNLKENFSGLNEVHHIGCDSYKHMSTLQFLGKHRCGGDALATAQQLGFSETDGCDKCLPECHRGCH